MNDHFASLTGSDSNTGYSIYIYTRYALKFTMGVRFDEKKICYIHVQLLWF